MELTIQQLKKGMVVKAVFYHSRMPESFYTKELGIVHDVDINNNLVTIEIITQGFHNDKYVYQTDFFISPHERYFVTNANMYGFRQFCGIESCDIEELRKARFHLQTYCEKETQKLQDLHASLEFLDNIIKNLE